MLQKKSIDILKVLLYITFAFLFLECLRTDVNTPRFILFAGLFVCAYLLQSFVRGKMYLFIPNTYFFVLGLFILYSAGMIAARQVLFPSVSTEMVLRQTINFCFLYVVYLFFRMEKKINTIIDLLIAIAALFVLYAIMRSLPTLLTKRMGESVGYNANSIAMLCGYMSGFAYMRYKQTGERRKYLAVMLLFLVGILFTGSRKGILTFVLCIVGIDFLLTGQKKKLMKLILWGLAAMLLLTLLLNVPVLYFAIGYRVEEMLSFLLTGETDEASLSTRMMLIDIAREKIVERPWTGFGLNAFRYYDSAHGMYSHNNYIELLFSGGAILAVIYYSLYIWLIVNAVRLYKKGTDNGNAAMVLVFSVVMLINDAGMVSYYSRYLMMIHLLLTCIVQKEKRLLKGKTYD